MSKIEEISGSIGEIALTSLLIKLLEQEERGEENSCLIVTDFEKYSLRDLHVFLKIVVDAGLLDKDEGSDFEKLHFRLTARGRLFAELSRFSSSISTRFISQ